MNIIAYKLPEDQTKYIYQSSDARSIDKGWEESSFLIYPFDPQKTPLLYPLGERMESIDQNMFLENIRDFGFRELTKGEYFDYIENIITGLKGYNDKKIVASRRSHLKNNKSINEIFNSLCENYPKAFVFCLSTEKFGCWIGASPEMLLEKEKDVVRSMSLAGTKRSGSDDDWDIKNKLEQKIVTDLITAVFKNNNLEPDIKSHQTLKNGNVEHLMTLIEGRYNGLQDMTTLIRELSPTPALSGFPRQEALETIRLHEGDRQLFGGCCGPVFSNSDFRLNVMIRCGCIERLNEITLFAGGGITALSEPEKEWDETEQKMKNMKNVL